jgi:hypothetical protein
MTPTGNDRDGNIEFLSTVAVVAPDPSHSRRDWLRVRLRKDIPVVIQADAAVGRSFRRAPAFRRTS